MTPARPRRNAAAGAERTLLRALLSDEWSSVLLRCLDGKSLPLFLQAEAQNLANAVWPLISGNLAPSAAIRELTAADLADYAAALRMEDSEELLSEAMIDDALYRLGEANRYRREMDQIRARITPEGEGIDTSREELLRQWSERARTLKRGGSSMDTSGDTSE